MFDEPLQRRLVTKINGWDGHKMCVVGVWVAGVPREADDAYQIAST